MKRLFAVLVMLVVWPAWADFAGGLDPYSRGDYATALKKLRPLAEHGYAGAQTVLGVMYARGEGVPQDYAEAVKWYRLAAEQGYALAQHDLGWMYALSKGVPQDDVAAHMWLNLAAAQGDPDAAQTRDMVASMMTPAQVEEAQQMAREWLAAHP